MSATTTDISRENSPLVASLYRRLIALLTWQSEIAFIFSVSFVWLVLYNTRFWHDAVVAMWHGSAGSALFLVSLFAVVLCVQALLLLLIPARRAMLAVAAVLFVVASITSYFIAKYGVVMNEDMLRNAFETDTAETSSLLTFELIARIVLLGLVPAAAMFAVRLPDMHWAKRLRQRAIAIASVLAVCAVALLSSSASYAVFFREHKPLRFALSPVAPVTSTIRLALDHRKQAAGPLINASGTATRIVP